MIINLDLSILKYTTKIPDNKIEEIAVAYMEFTPRNGK